MQTENKYYLKAPILRENQEIVQEFKLGPRPKTLNLGIATVIVYLISFITIYATATLNCNMNTNTITFPLFKKAYNPCFNKINANSFTMSHMFLYSNRYLSTILIAVTCTLIAVLLIEQNFGVTNEEIGRIFYVAGSFILAIMMGALLLFGPAEHSVFHVWLALVIVIAGTTMALGTTQLYKNAYESESLRDMQSSAWLLFIFAVCIVISVIVFQYARLYKIPELMRNSEISLGIFEIFHWFTFAIFLAILSTKPPLLVNNFCAISI